jgi:hypothetical protein
MSQKILAEAGTDRPCPQGVLGRETFCKITPTIECIVTKKDATGQRMVGK